MTRLRSLSIKERVRQHVLPIAWRPTCTAFHYLAYSLGIGGWNRTHWLGVPVLKLPSDLWMYHEVIWETRPNLIVETGTARGGSALFFAHLFDLMATDGRVITVDITRPREGYPDHRRIRFVTASSTDPNTVALIRSHISPTDKVMVILDSDHSATHVRQELELYSPVVTQGCYLVVEDTNVNGHPVCRTHGPGPMEALAGFLAGSSGRDFEADLTRDTKFGFTFYPHGWLRRIGPKSRWAEPAL